MTNTEKIAKDVCDRHGLPSSLYHHMDELPYVPADEIERRFAYRGKPYIDVDGEWRTGQEFPEQAYVPQEWQREANSSALMLGRVLIFCILALLGAVGWMVYALWPIIKVIAGGRP